MFSDTDLTATSESTTRSKRRGADDDDDEKDVAEPSLRKIEEDEELEGSITSGAPLPEATDPSATSIIMASTQNVSDAAQGSSQAPLFVEINTDTESENFKEFSQISPKNRGESDNAGVPSREAHNQDRSVEVRNLRVPTSTNGARSRLIAGHTRSLNCDYDEDFAKEKKLLDYEQCGFSKVDAEWQENEKNHKRRAQCNRNHNTTSDLDEMYRLPTEHLRIDRDYSNERIKHKRLTKVQRQYLALYRDGINEINERLKEATLDGAVGGEDDHVVHENAAHLHNTHLHNAHLHNAAAYVNNTTATSQQHILTTHDSSYNRYHVVTTNHPNQHITVSNISIIPTTTPTPASVTTTIRNNQRVSPVTPSDLEAPGSNPLQRHLANQQQRILSGNRERRGGDGLSSPEDRPSSPRASGAGGFASGARPKKSPRKQKAI